MRHDERRALRALDHAGDGEGIVDEDSAKACSKCLPISNTQVINPGA